MNTRCPDCASVKIIASAGDGKCSNCYGSGRVGTIADDIGRGKPACPRCHGTGRCATCGGRGFVDGPAPQRLHANAELNPFDDKVAIKTRCPKCDALDWFEWKFLGKLTDPGCGYTWYVDSGTYTAQQTRAVFKMSKRGVKYMTHGVSGEGAWIGKLFGGFLGIVIGIVFRLPFAVIMVPIQAVVRVSSAKSKPG